jgi:hypothetical protein
MESSLGGPGNEHGLKLRGILVPKKQFLGEYDPGIAIFQVPLPKEGIAGYEGCLGTRSDVLLSLPASCS